MALLGQIRNRFGWLMLLLIGLSTLAFLFMDSSGPGGSGGGRSTSVVGAVNGNEILRTDVQAYVDDMQGMNFLPEEARGYAWEQLLREALVKQQADAIGLKVTSDEMGVLFTDAQNMSPMVRQYFQQMTPDQIRDQVAFYQDPEAYSDRYTEEQWQNIEPQIPEIQKSFRSLEKRVANGQLSSKYLSMLQKGFYTPDWMTEVEYKRENQQYNFQYVRVPYGKVTNEEAAITDAELETYVSENALLYADRKAMASIEFVTFEVKPTSEDSMVFFNELNDIMVEVKTTDNDTTTAFNNDGILSAVFVTKDELVVPAEMKDSIMAADEGTVFGPYVNGNQYQLLKVVEKRTLPDSVRSRHIVRPVQTQEDAQREYLLLDSLRKAIANNELTFDSAAAQYGTDGTKFKGGDLGFYAKGGGFDEVFENQILYGIEKDSMKIFQTQFGVHLVEVTDEKFETNKKGIRTAIFSRNIIPSERTEQKVRMDANTFVSSNKDLESFRQNAQAGGLRQQEATGLEPQGFMITGIGKNSASAEIIGWAHIKAQPGEVSSLPYSVTDDALNYTKAFIVPALVAKTEAGKADLKDPVIRKEVEREVGNVKKAGIIKNNIASAGTLQEAASKYSVNIEQTTNPVTYGSAYIPGAGVEPSVLAVASTMEINTMSKPIEGEEAVYVIQLLIKSDGSSTYNVEVARSQANQKASNVLTSGIFDILKREADIEDNRNKIYAY